MFVSEVLRGFTEREENQLKINGIRGFWRTKSQSFNVKSTIELKRETRDQESREQEK
jgi:hypothetical protein